MASEYYGLNRGDTEFNTATGTSSPGKDIEVRVDLTKGFHKGEVLQKIEELKNAILTDRAKIWG